LNLFEIAIDAFKSRANTANQPLTVNEAANLWTFLTATESFMNSEMTQYNFVQDEELKAKILDLSNNLHMAVITEIKDLLLKEGVQLPDQPTEKSQFEVTVPTSTRMSDEEVGNMLAFNLVWAINFCARGMTEAVRSDVGTMFLKYMLQKTAFSVTLKTMMIGKGWIKIPPSYVILSKT
jgi:hypothetical protein